MVFSMRTHVLFALAKGTSLPLYAHQFPRSPDMYRADSHNHGDFRSHTFDAVELPTDQAACPPGEACEEVSSWESAWIDLGGEA